MLTSSPMGLPWMGACLVAMWANKDMISDLFEHHAEHNGRDVVVVGVCPGTCMIVVVWRTV